MKETVKQRKQKVDPKLKYNKKEWVHVCEREVFNQDEVAHLIYNDIPLDRVYTRADNMYVRNKDTDEHKEE